MLSVSVLGNNKRQVKINEPNKIDTSSKYHLFEKSQCVILDPYNASIISEPCAGGRFAQQMA
jgi:hypothetical protein